VASATSVKLSIPRGKVSQRSLLCTAKHLHELELSISQSQYHFIQSLKYIKSVTSLILDGLPDIPLERYKRLFRHLRTSIKCLTIKLQTLSSLHILQFLMSFPNLKIFRFDAGCLSEIPLSILQQKEIKFDLRVCPLESESSFSSLKNNQAISSIEVLGLNSERWFDARGQTWYQIEEAQREIEINTRGNLLWFNFIDLKSDSLLNLFNTCKNISTLNLILPSSTNQEIDFSGLCALSNLKNIFLQFYEFHEKLANLFTSLATLAENHKKLEMVAFDSYECSSSVEENYHIAQPFFEASQDIIKKFLLKLLVSKDCLEGISYLCQRLKKLKQISSLTILLHDIYDDRDYCNDEELCNCHYSLLTNLFENMSCLTELDLALPDIHDKNLVIDLPSSLQKLSLDLPSGRPCSSLLKSISTLVNLQQLNLVLPIEEEIWANLYKIIHKSDQLEAVRLKFQTEEFLIPDQDLIFLMKNKKNLRLILIAKLIQPDENYECFIFTRKGCQPDIDSFLRLGSYDKPLKTIPQKSYYFD